MNFYAAPLPARHGFFTRKGGVSTGPYASLNCSFSGADAPENIRRNRAVVAQEMGVAPEHLLGLNLGRWDYMASWMWMPRSGGYRWG